MPDIDAKKALYEQGVRSGSSRRRPRQRGPVHAWSRPVLGPGLPRWPRMVAR